MKHFNLLGSLLLSGACLVGGTNLAVAQSQYQPMKDNIIANLSSVRLMVNTPTNLTGTKKASIADWGAQPSTPMLNKPVIQGEDSLAATNPLTNAAAVAGKVCLLYRGGGISFVTKATAAASAGAIAVIIVNNVPGDPIAMGGGTGVALGIPVMMVTQADGDLINEALHNNVPVTVSFGTWALGATHDLGIVGNYQATPHATNVPYTQLAGTSGAFPYSFICGGGVANYGTATEHNIVVTDSVYWTPTGGSASFKAAHSYTIDSIAPADSIKFGFNATPYTLAAPTGQGSYSHNYSMTYDSVALEGTPQDNLYTFNHNISDSIVCKGAYDFTKYEPNVSISIQPAGGSNNFTMGPIFYMPNGGYASKVQYYLSINPPASLENLTASVYVFKWTDTLQKDSTIEAGELQLMGANIKNFTSADTFGVFTVDLTDDNGSPFAQIDANSHYWVAVEAPLGSFLGMDKTASWFSRAYGFYLAGGVRAAAGTADPAESIIGTDLNTGLADPNNVFGVYPFAGNALFIDSVQFDRYNEVPAVAMHMYKTAPVGVKNVTKNIGNVTLFPNPAQGSTNVSVELNNASKNVTYKVIDALGRSMYSETHHNVQSEKVSLDVSRYAAGNYYLLIGTDNGTTFKKFTVIK
ncbi:T9SS type A sorting domain-containing protein [Taibaiella soli]|uniref:PA domain-containing protein n=1 Tax=Taibaiella soli TaxID=1649169 RepID=A0A2W2BCZ7_9BACT|nr:T9SS type A sorting domain-containing protein [Taibaiella soli]PZF71536.1 hypothetical protein DN068_18010 [Taibaiella soli]